MIVWLACYRGVTNSVHIDKASAIKANEKDRKSMMKMFEHRMLKRHWTVEMKKVRFT